MTQNNRSCCTTFLVIRLDGSEFPALTHTLFTILKSCEAWGWTLNINWCSPDFWTINSSERCFLFQWGLGDLYHPEHWRCPGFAGSIFRFCWGWHDYFIGVAMLCNIRTYHNPGLWDPCTWCGGSAGTNAFETGRPPNTPKGLVSRSRITRPSLRCGKIWQKTS